MTRRKPSAPDQPQPGFAFDPGIAEVLLPTTDNVIDPSAGDMPPPHYHGHRERLRQRFLNHPPESLPDYELLELILFTAIPRRDVKPMAKTLIAEFGSLAGVLAAPVEKLMVVDGIKENTATFLRAVHAAGIRVARADIIDKPLLNSMDSLVGYCRAAMGRAAREQFRILFLDKRNRLIKDEVQQEGTVDHTPVYTREVVKRALEIGATAIILVHNHPSGDATPSKADITMTQQIIQAAQTIGIMVHDHIIVTRGDYCSMRSEGLI